MRHVSLQNNESFLGLQMQLVEVAIMFEILLAFTVEAYIELREDEQLKLTQRNLKCGECITQKHQPILKGWSCIFAAQESEKEEVGVFAAPNISSWATDKR